MALLWLFPLLWTVYTSFRPYSATPRSTATSRSPQTLTLDNYRERLGPGPRSRCCFLNTLIILIPAVILVLLLASAIAFAVSRFSFKFNIVPADAVHGRQPPPGPGHHHAALPDVPGCSRSRRSLSDNGVWYDQYFGIMLIHIAFQLGFCTFVLSNYMKTIPKELTEAALVDGASVLRTFWQVILPLCRPPLAALATLEFTFIYNDFFWALVLMFTGDKRPITSALNDLQGAVLHGQQPARGRRDHHRPADDDRVLRAAAPVRARA